MNGTPGKKSNVFVDDDPNPIIYRYLLLFSLFLLFLLPVFSIKPACAQVSVYHQLFFSEKETVPQQLPVPEKKLAVKGLKLVSNVDLIRRVPFSLSQVSKTDLAVQKDSGEFHNFLKASQVDWNFKENLNVKFCWNSTETGVTSAVWQVSTMRFPPDNALWENPPGLVASGPAVLQNVQNGKYPKVFLVDFSSFAPRPPSKVLKIKTLSDQKPSNLQPVKQISIKKSIPQVVSKEQPAVTGLKIKTAPKIKIDPKINLKQDKGFSSLNMNYFVRLVTLGPDGQPAGIPCEPVRILYGDPIYDGSIKVEPDAFEKPEALHPQIRVERYLPIQNQATDAMYHVIAIRDIPNPFGGEPLIRKGDKFNLRPRQEDKSFLESVGDFFSDVVSWAVDAVNWASRTYENIKNAAIDAACSVAGERFRGAFEMGLNIGMAAIGVPPGIPNFDELTDMGVEYLVAVAAEQAIGAGVDPMLATEAAEKGVNAFVDEMRREANGGGDMNAFFKPDPDYYYRPAYMELKITNPESVPTNQVTGKIRVTVKDGNWDEDLFHEAFFHVPSIRPGQTVTLPVYLEENMENKFEDHDYYAGMQRFWTRYLMPAKVLVLSGIYETWYPDRPSGGPGDYKYENYEEAHQVFTIQDCRQVMMP